MFGMRKPAEYEIEAQKNAARVAILTTQAHLKVKLLEDAAEDARKAIQALSFAMIDSGQYDSRPHFEVSEAQNETHGIIFDVQKISRRLPDDGAGYPHTSADDGRYDPFAQYADDDPFEFDGEAFNALPSKN